MNTTLLPPRIPSPVVGLPRNRLDGGVKVQGQADYTSDHHVEGMLYGVFAVSPVPAGTITALDTSQAETAPGVAQVFTHLNAPRLASPPLPAASSFLPLQSPILYYEGQPVALVAAESWEAAVHAATLLRAVYDVTPAHLNVRGFPDFEALEAPPEGYDAIDTRTGEAPAAFQAAPVKVAARYTIGFRHHNAMEPPATLAYWEGDRLTQYDATQHVWGVRSVLAAVFGVPEDHVRIISHYLGGGFGSKGFVWPHQILTPAFARVLGRPLRVVLTRAQMFAGCGYQSETVQDVRLGAERDGTLRSVEHDVAYANCVYDGFPEYAAAGTRTMYRSEAIATRHRIVRVNTIMPTPMRSPNEGMGNFGLESAMDELAGELGLDPLELRLRNYAERDPTTGKPYSSKKLREAYLLGAERFGWASRPESPRAMRDGHDWVGYGMASALMSTYRFPSTARVRLRADGRAFVESGAQEIGTGIRTIIPQIAADVLGLDPHNVEMVLGDTTLPQGGPTYGSSSTMGLGSAVARAAEALRRSIDPERSGDALVEALRAGARPDASAEASWSPADDASEERFAIFTFGGVFVEVRVDADLGLVRVTRCVGAYSAGRIINEKTARSQMTGGMIWGIGQALLERSETDERLGRFMSKNLAGYLVPAHADVPRLEAYFIDEYDEHASDLGAKGIGELGSTGVAAAIANAVYHACGVRVRDLPIRPETLLDSSS
jgi:xanthine dehydrogenase YagR molybdenum-binding subunit